MMKLWYPLLFGASVSMFYGQKISSSKWDEVFSYNNILQIREDNGKLLTATENGIFQYDTQTGKVEKYLSKTTGLHNVDIQAFDYNSDLKIGLVGYADGSLDVFSEDGVFYIVDAPINTTYSGTKAIHHIHIEGEKAVISADYGVSIFNIVRKEYEETAFFPTPAQESVIKNGYIYAIIGSEILKFNKDINDKQNLISFNIKTNWENIASGDFKNLASNGQILAYSDGNSLSINENIVNISGIKDININGDNIIVNTTNAVSIFDKNGNLIQAKNIDNELNTSWFNNQNFYFGTLKKGLFSNEKNLTPSGPYANRATKINLLKDKIWVSTGYRHDNYAQLPVPTPISLGFYFYDGKDWIYPSYFENNSVHFNILDAIGKPSDYRETFFTNHNTLGGQGFYKMTYNSISKDFDLEKYYSEGQNNQWQNRPVGFSYDENENLFATTDFYIENGEQIKYAIYNPNTDVFNYRKIVNSNPIGGATKTPIYKDGKLYIATPRKASVIIVDLNNTPTNIEDDTIHFLDENNGLIPNSSGRVQVLALDKNNELWIGEATGLRVANSIAKIPEQTQFNPIIIEQKGLGEELFRNSKIIDIEVDDSNYKWVSVDGGGVFYLSPNGQQTLLHFTKENSPLPTNEVYDIKVDKLTGKVYFATLKGIVTYQGDAKDTTANFGEVLVYPNPIIYSHFKGNVRIKGLSEKAFIRITDSAGNLVHQGEARGGWYDWDLTHRGKRVASGIYFVLMTNEDGTNTATAKIAVIN